MGHISSELFICFNPFEQCFGHALHGGGQVADLVLAIGQGRNVDPIRSAGPDTVCCNR